METAVRFDRDRLQGELLQSAAVNEIPSSPSPQPVSRPSVGGGLWLIPFVLVIAAWSAVILQQTIFWKVLRSRMTKRGRCRSVPCTSCRFFNSNPYLQCAVHPTRVLRPDAADCSDYQQRE
ncbi:MAG: hypothetical protein ACFB8W_15695 [Elainellaceae cyanobacterium]